ncbi:hypothetical protein B1R32_11637 [Abditibacterium utsteinense]|uniref:Uncharacterized protein n=1 Tax=Abditibacterium utsteinense TaxID=1960156 RepID=A0A2S8SQJ2_9BACT|nr:hypothetical protein [Abditibacterium utsteinense]PQV63060.1 hypothetical protein B1R32_11637 [Abditibacterium utsteinense]
MTKIPARLVASLLIIPATFGAFRAFAAPSKKSKVRLAAIPKAAKRASGQISTANMPRYVSLATIKKLQKQNPIHPGAALQPMWEGHALKTPMRDLLTGPSLDLPALLPAKANVKTRANAQRFPRPIAPASPARLRAARNNATPKWVRYPLEFQLAGIGLGTRAVDKDRFNRIDRYGLFALHGNPTAVVRQIGGTTVVGGEGGATSGPSGSQGGGRAPGIPGLPGGEGSAGAAPASGSNLTLPQTPPETAALFPQSQFGGGLPDWALAVTVKLDNNHVEWLYKRETYAMGFVVDRLGFVDAIIVAGLSSDITRTQLEDPIHTVKLGDDLRKVMFRYGYPDDLVPLAADPAAVANDTTGAPGGGGGGGADAALGGGAFPGGLAGRGGPGGAGGADTGAVAAAAAGSNGAFRTYDLRYEQSYNVVFTIRNNRVVRIYIFGDPDFFNAQRRNQIRAKY